MGGVKQILLTGATGYLGSRLAEAFIQEGYELIIIKRKTSSSNRIDHLLQSLKSYDLEATPIRQIMSENNIDCVVHTAASYGRKGETLAEVYNANLYFPIQLLENCFEHKIQYFINTDTALPANLNTYSLSKKQFSELLKLEKDSITSVNIELEYFYGSGDDKSKFVTYILDKLLRNSPSIDLSAGTQFRDFIYVDDVVKAYLTLLNSVTSYIGFNDVSLGSGKAFSLREIVEKIKKLSGNSYTSLNFGALPIRSNEVMHSQANTEFLFNIGWVPEYNIEQGLIETIKKEKILYDLN